MNDEIKKILEVTDNKECYYVGTNGCLYQDLTKEELLLIKDYIINLQKENQILKENAIHNDKVVDKARWNENIYKSRIEKALRMLNHIGLVIGRQLTINEMSKLYSILQGDSND